MPDSRRERIVKHIQQTLEGITTANGYDNTVASVQRFRHTGNVYINTPVIVIGESDERASDGPSGFIMKELEILLEVTHRLEDADLRSGDEVMNSLCADIEKALHADRHRGQQAKDTGPISSEPIPAVPGQPDIARILQFTVLYQHPAGDPRG